jgi:hypothetical protein
MTTTGLKGQIQKFATADARLNAELSPLVREGVHEVGDLAKQNFGWSSQIPGQEFETASFLTGTVGFSEVGYPHKGKVHTFEGDGTAPSPFDAPVYGGPGVHQMMTRPGLGPAARAVHPKFIAAARAAVHRAFS